MTTSPEILVKKKNIILDATLLSSLMGCPRKLDLAFNHRFISINGKSNSLEVGTLVHIVLEYFYKSLIQGFKRDLAIASGLTAGQEYIIGCTECISKTCKRHKEPWLGLKNTPVESDGRYVGWKWALQTCEEYFQFYRNDFWVSLETEVVKGEVIYEDESIRVMWKAKYDWIVDTNQGIYPVDHKTSKQTRETLSLNNQFMGQCLLMKTRGMMINKIGFQKTLKPEEKFTRVLIPYSIERILEFQTEIIPHYAYQFLSYFESEHWPPNFTQCESKYGNCVFKDVCEANPNMREEVLRQGFMIGPEWSPSNEGE
jgi:hypothetical protein